MPYSAESSRYTTMEYKRCGRSGVLLPRVSLGLWHNFGSVDILENCRAMLRRAFDLGITHFDLANNYGPVAGSAEENFGRLLRQDFLPYRDELIISSKAGYRMWPGPYGEMGSRKYIVASCDQSLKRMGLDYVDIFYSHRPDKETPLEETMGALDYLVRSGRALYVGISNYPPDMTARAADILKDLGTPCLIHQPRYNMFGRDIENGLLDVLEEKGMGCICFSPLAQGQLTDKYLGGIPEGSRAAKKHGALKAEYITDKRLDAIQKLNELAKERGQTMAQMTLAWNLRHPQMTSVLIGASSSSQIDDSVRALANLDFAQEELERVNAILESVQ